MQEDNTLSLLEVAFAAIVDQAGGTLAGIDGVQQDRLKLGKHANGLQRVFARNAVAGAHIAGVGNHVAARHDIRAAQFFGGLQGQVEDVLFLLFLRRPHADAQQRNTSVYRLQPCDQTGLGASTAGCSDQMVDDQGTVIGLGHQFERAVHIAKSASGIRSAARNEIDRTAFGPQSLGHQFHLCLHVHAACPLRRRGAVQVIQQYIAVAIVVGIVGAGAIFQQDVAG